MGKVEVVGENVEVDARLLCVDAGCRKEWLTIGIVRLLGGPPIVILGAIVSIGSLFMLISPGSE